MTKMAHVPAHRTDFFFHKKKQQFCAMVFESLETKNGVLVLHGNMKKSDVTGVFFHFFLFRSSVKVKVAEKSVTMRPTNEKKKSGLSSLLSHCHARITMTDFVSQLPKNHGVKSFKAEMIRLF